MFSYVSLYSLLVLSSCSELHEKLFRNLLRLCPEQYVPNDNGRVAKRTSDSGSCCTDYFNESLQVELDSNKAVPGEHEHTTCLFPKTGDTPKYPTEKSFYMITHSPKDGCLSPENHTAAITNDFYQPTCNDSEVIPFMKLLPVSSTSNGLIYKNPNCASCHGQYDVIVWQPYATCKNTYAFSYDLDKCVFSFVYPGNYDDIRHLECSVDRFSACPSATSVQVPSGSDLSTDEIAIACSMTGLPRFAHVYATRNVFCYICQFNRGLDRFPLPECSAPSAVVPDRNTNGRRFIRLIDHGLIQQIAGSTLGHPPERTVCGVDGNTKVCHQVLCPLGQVMDINDHAGDGIDCQMESTQWVAATFEMLLLLQFGGSIDVDDASLKNMFTTDKRLNPWGKSWVVVSVFRPLLEYDTMMIDDLAHRMYNISNVQELDTFSHVLVKLNYQSSSVTSATFVNNIQETLTKPWYLKKNGKTYKAIQNLSRYKLIPFTTNLGEKGSAHFFVPFGQLSNTVFLQKRSLYKTVFDNTNTKTVSFVLNKLYLCQQVALTPESFNVTVFKRTPIALYYHQTGSYLFDTEFVRVKGLNGESMYRICVSDTKFKSTSNGRLRLSLDSHLLLFVAVCQQFMIHT